jgi:serine/threonine protein kinase
LTAPGTLINLAAPLIPGWRIVRPLSSGAQAHTYIVAPAGRPHDECGVAKVMRLTALEGHPLSIEGQRWRMEREVAALESLARAECPGVVRLLDHGPATANTEQGWMVMRRHETAARWFDGSTFCYAECFRGRVTRVMGFAESLARTLSVMHGRPQPIVHRDLHLGNVLMDGVGAQPVLADFGIAHVAGFARRPEGDPVRSGAWHWRPPELDAGDRGSPASDVFMLGGLVFEALSGGFVLPPAEAWAGRSPHDARDHHLGRWTTDFRIPMVHRLLHRLLALDPAERPSAGEVAERCRDIRLAGTRRAVPIAA